MSIIFVRDAFTDAIGEKGTVLSATMQYSNGGRQQVLTFVVQNPDGSETTVSDTVSATTDLVTHAKDMGAAFASS